MNEQPPVPPVYKRIKWFLIDREIRNLYIGNTLLGLHNFWVSNFVIPALIVWTTVLDWIRNMRGY